MGRNLAHSRVVVLHMIREAFMRAALAELYIIGVALLITQVFERFLPDEDTFMTPIVVLSLLVLSVATMAYLFFGKPLEFGFDGEAGRGLRFLLATIASFAVLTAGVCALALLWPLF